MGGGTALLVWIGVIVAAAALAWFWRRRSPFLWGPAAAVIYGLVEDPSVGPLRGGGRFLPIDDPRLGTLSSVAVTLALVLVAMAVLPQRGPGRRRRRSPGGQGGHRPPPGAGDFKQCPTCVETIRASAEICPFCGHRFAAEMARRQG